MYVFLYVVYSIPMLFAVKIIPVGGYSLLFYVRISPGPGRIQSLTYWAIHNRESRAVLSSHIWKAGGYGVRWGPLWGPWAKSWWGFMANKLGLYKAVKTWGGVHDQGRIKLTWGWNTVLQGGVPREYLVKFCIGECCLLVWSHTLFHTLRGCRCPIKA